MLYDNGPEFEFGLDEPGMMRTEQEIDEEAAPTRCDESGENDPDDEDLDEDDDDDYPGDDDFDDEGDDDFDDDPDDDEELLLAAAIAAAHLADSIATAATATHRDNQS